MRKSRMLIAPALLLAGALVLFGSEVVEEIVAIVNDDVITLSQYKEAYETASQMIKSQLQGEEQERQLAMLKSQLLDSLITNTLLLQAARDKHLNVGAEVKSYIDRLKKENNIESDDDLIRALQQQGMDFESWKKGVEEGIMREMLTNMEVDRGIVIDDSETVSHYKQHPEEFTEPEEYKLRAIYLSPEGKTQENLEALKNEISAKLASKEDLGALAAQYSEGPGKDAQGDLGTFKKGELDKILQEAAAKLKVGEVSGWVKAKNGWYVLKLEEKKESRLKTYDESKREIEQRLYGEKRQKKFNEFLKDLKERSYIKILKPDPLGL